MIETSIHNVGPLRVSAVFPDNGMSMRIQFGDHYQMVLYGVPLEQMLGMINTLGTTDDFRYSCLSEDVSVAIGPEAAEAAVDRLNKKVAS